MLVLILDKKAFPVHKYSTEHYYYFYCLKFNFFTVHGPLVEAIPKRINQPKQSIKEHQVMGPKLGDLSKGK